MQRSLPRWSSNGSTSSTASKAAKLTSARRKNLDLALLGGGVFVISAAALWDFKRRQQQKQSQLQQSISVPAMNSPTFTVKSGSSSKTLDMLSVEEIDLRLTKYAASMTLARPGNPVQRMDTSSLASNSPCEDDSAFALLERDSSNNRSNTSSSASKDLVFFGVFDGHAGWHTSKVLRERLITYVARELHKVYTGALEYQQLRLQSLAKASSATSATATGQEEPAEAPVKPAVSFFRRLLSSGWLTKSASGDYVLKDLDADDSIVSSALRNGFKALDADLVLNPIRLLERQGLFLNSRASSSSTTSSSSGQHAPKMGNVVSEAQANALQTLLPAISGSCGLLAFVDAARRKLHVACTGDSRAVMGTWDESAGKWKVDVLTEDQTAKNLHEVQRMQSEHPEEEKETVVRRGRVLGGLEPSRAFGDGRYKWPVGTSEKLNEAFAPGKVRPTRPNYHTPPYVTAEPVVTTRDLAPSSSNADAPASSSKSPTNKFVVLATDGLWDRLDNQTVVGLVGAALSGQTSNLSTSALRRRVVPDDKPEPPGVHPAAMTTSSFVFQDTNLATHLVRNALGGADKQSLRALLSIPPPLSRRYRDDITVTVVLLGDPPRDLTITAEPLSAKL